MARLWLGVTIGGLGVGLLLAMTNCAEPTQIVVDVYTDACPATGKKQVINATGIAVGTADTIESRRPSSTKVGCESQTVVGTLTLYPSGNKDDEVAIKVLGGIESTPDRCDPPLYAGCIVHRRMMRFVPHTTQHATVRLLLACLNRQCPPGLTCDNGACVSASAVLDDGGAAADAERTESSVVDAGTADVGDPLCAGCKGDCANGKCTVDCAKVDCSVRDVCAPALDCEIKCGKTGSCNDVACTSNKKCTVNCGSEQEACGKVTCNADECNVTCRGTDSCGQNSNIILVGAAKVRLNCDGQSACNTASCTSKDCGLNCNPLLGNNVACPNRPWSCTALAGGNCTKWNLPTSN